MVLNRNRNYKIIVDSTGTFLNIVIFNSTSIRHALVIASGETKYLLSFGNHCRITAENIQQKPSLRLSIFYCKESKLISLTLSVPGTEIHVNPEFTIYYLFIKVYVTLI